MPFEIICANSTVVSSSSEVSNIASLSSLESISNESSKPKSYEKISSETSSSSVISAETTVAPQIEHLKCPNVRTTLVLKPEKVYLNYIYIYCHKRIC